MSVRDPAVRNVTLLAICQALAMTGMTMNMTVTALTGHVLSPDPAWATLPLSLQFMATMLTTMPASLYMRRVGRRLGFATGVLVGREPPSFVAPVISSMYCHLDVPLATCHARSPL